MPATPNYRGDAVVLQGEAFTRNEQGVWVKTQTYTGIKDALVSFAAQFPAGNQLRVDQSGPLATLTATLGFLTGDGTDSAPIDKWEDDVEPIEKDLAFSDLAQAMSQKGRQGLNDYRQMSASERKDFKVADYVDVTSDDAALLTDLLYEVDRGVEAVPVDTIILKRTRTMASAFVSPRRLTVRQSFYSTAKLIELEGIPKDTADALPIVPYQQPDFSEWGWRPRLSNRSYIGRGLVEEHSDWVFAAWSTTLFTYVP